MLPHPQVELGDELQHRWRRLERDDTPPAKVLDEVSNLDHHDPASRAAKARCALALPTTTASSEMLLELLKQVTVHRRDVRASTAQPHSEMKDRTERSFDCQRAVADGEALIHEPVEEFAERLRAQYFADLRRKEGAEAGSIMRSRSGHLDVASNGNRDEIIPSSA